MSTRKGDFYAGRRVFVSGGSGLVGSAFVAELLTRGALVRVVQHERVMPRADELEVIRGDLRDPDVVRAACEGMDFVVQASGVSGGSKRVAEDPIPMYSDTLWMQTMIIDVARAAGVSRFLYVSNSSVYPASDSPLLETDALTGPPENETGLVKQAGEAQCQVTAGASDMKVAIIRTGNAYGPWDNFDLDSSHVAPALINKAVNGDGPLSVWGDGSALRDFIHTEDIARGGLFMLEHHADGIPVNIATGTAVSIAGLAELILQAAGRGNARVETTGSSPPASPIKILDIGRMRDLGFEPSYSLQEGLNKAVAWYRSHHAVSA